MRITIDIDGSGADIGFGENPIMAQASCRAIDHSDIIRLFHCFLSWYPPLTVMEQEIRILQEEIKK